MENVQQFSHSSRYRGNERRGACACAEKIIDENDERGSDTRSYIFLVNFASSGFAITGRA